MGGWSCNGVQLGERGVLLADAAELQEASSGSQRHLGPGEPMSALGGAR